MGDASSWLVVALLSQSIVRRSWSAVQRQIREEVREGRNRIGWQIGLFGQRDLPKVGCAGDQRHIQDSLPSDHQFFRVREAFVEDETIR